VGSQVLAAAVALILTGTGPTRAAEELQSRRKFDTWEYFKVGNEIRTCFNGEPIRYVVPEDGHNDGGFDRPLGAFAPHRYIFIDAQLTLLDAASIKWFWVGFDPRTPTDYVVIDARDEIRFVFAGRSLESAQRPLSPELLTKVRRHLASVADAASSRRTPPPASSDPART
jgi:hypothetical protein